ncbi:MAG: RraA family protein [Bacteroidales bacterium]|nr:RraA family protein [Bacteroidales bacterium]
MIKESTKLEQLTEMLDHYEIKPLGVSDEEICERLEKLYTGAINDVLREHCLLDQALPNNIMPLKMDMCKAGVAYTIRSAPNPTVGGEMNVRAQMLDAMPKGCCVVWDAGIENEASHWGEVMTASALARHARMAVINGGIRDTRQVLAQNFPVFYRYRTSNGSLGRTKITEFNVPVRIGKTYIKPGDFIFGDIDGVVVIPRAIALEVLERAERINSNEREMRTMVYDGFSAVEMINNGGYF